MGIQKHGHFPQDVVRTISEAKKASGLGWKKFFEALRENTLPEQRAPLPVLIQE